VWTIEEMPAATRVPSFLAFVARRRSSLMTPGACSAASILILAVALLCGRCGAHPA
jgi:hypothetical protein